MTAGNPMPSSSEGLDAMVPAAAMSPIGAAPPSDGGSAQDSPLASTLSDAGNIAAQDDTDAFDFDAVLDSLLDSGTSAAKGLDPVALQRGVQTFSAVLAPPDVDVSPSGASDFASHGLTAMTIADALAGDVSADDLHAEANLASMSALADMGAMDALAAARNSMAAAPDLALRK